LRAERLKITRLEPPAVDSPRPVRARQRRRRPIPLALARQAPAKLADVPRPADIEREQAAREFIPDVRDLGVGHGRREAFLEDPRVEAERASKRGCENAPRVSSSRSNAPCCSASAKSGSGSLSGNSTP
jgi:hypothetical protein